MLKVKDIAAIIEKFAPLELQEDYDNCGLLFGNPDWEVRGISVTLDLNVDVVNEALAKGANVIVTHHPVIFAPVKRLEYELPTHKAFSEAVKHDIAIYAAHTNFDFAEGGMNDVLMCMLGAEDVGLIDGNARGARIGKLKEPCTLCEFAAKVGEIISDKHIAYVGDPEKKIRTFAAINGGGGAEEYVLSALHAGADVFLSGDFKYHVIRLAKDLGYAIINFGHFESEKHFVSLMTELLSANGVKEVYGTEALANPYN